MSTNILRQLFVVFFAIGQFVTTLLLSETFNSVTTDGLNNNPIYFLPAGYTFAIWGVIQLLSATYATYQLRPDQADRTLHQNIGWWVVLNTICFSVWTYFAVQQGMPGTQDFQPLWILATLPIMLVMLVSNVIAFLNIRQLADTLTMLDKWLTIVPVAVYFGWITVATVANTTAYLYAAGWTGTQLGVPITVALLIIAFLIAGAMTLMWNVSHGVVAYAAVFIWAAIGIAANNIDQSQTVTLTALIVAGAMLLLLITHVNQDKFPIFFSENSSKATTAS
ncbi:MAG: hypothetical protein AAFQ07_06125, partial [Chloroflexota bacterium]